MSAPRTTEKSSRMIAHLILYLAVLQQLCPVLAALDLNAVEKLIVTRRGEYDSDLFRVFYKTGYQCTAAIVCGFNAFENNTVPCSCTCNNGAPTFLPELGGCADMPTARKFLFGSCSNPLGMESRQIIDSQLTSLTHKNNWDPFNGRLNNVKAWCSGKNVVGKEYFQIDLQAVRHVSAITTQGVKSVYSRYVTSFQIEYSYDGSSWWFYNNQNGVVTFNGNWDANSKKVNTFRGTFETRFLRIYPKAYKWRMCLRVELYGCSDQAVCSRFFEWSFFLKSLNLESERFPRFNSDGKYDSCHVVPQSTSYYSYNAQNKWVDVCNDFFKMGINQQNQDVFKWKVDKSKKLLGRIIRVMVTCNYTSTSKPPKTGCLVFKASGQITYNLDITTSTTSCPTKSTTVAPQLGSSSSLFVPSPATLTASSTSVSLVPPFSLFAPTSSSSEALSSSLLLPPSSSLPLVTSLQSSTKTASILLYPSTSFLTSQPCQTEFVSTTEMILPPLGTSRTYTAPPTKTVISTDKQEPIVSIKPSKSSSATEAASSSAAPPDGPGNKEARTNGNNNGTVIGAAVGGAAALGIVVIVIIVLCKRRKLGKNKEKATSLEVKNPVYGSSDIPLSTPTENQLITSSEKDSQPTYQGLINNNAQTKGPALYSSPEDNYDNYTVYQSLDKKIPETPVYENLKKGQVVTGKPKPSATGNPSARSIVVAEPVYNVLKQPDAEQGTMPEKDYWDPEHDDRGETQDPLYNVLDGPDAEQNYEAPDVGDPLYNVLEGPESKQGPQEPLYNVLESSEVEGSPPGTQGPYDGSNSEPLYNVLEGPESDGPNMGGAGYAAPNGFTSPDAHDNPAYEETLQSDVPYASVHKPGSQRESVYEPLRGSGTQDLYERISKRGT